MKFRQNIDLGKAFETLKNDLIRIEKQTKEDKPTVLDTGLKYADAYGRLSAAVQYHIAWNTDIGFDFLQKALETPENAEIPTLERHINNPDDDVPNDIFPHRNDLHNPSNIHP